MGGVRGTIALRFARPLTPPGVARQGSMKSAQRDRPFFAGVVHDLCGEIAERLRTDRVLLSNLLAVAARDADRNRSALMFLDVPASNTEEWRDMSPDVHAVYTELSNHVCWTKWEKDDCSPAIANVPAALCLWVTEVHCAFLLRALEHGLGASTCISCMAAEADAAVNSCGHAKFCVACLRAWEQRRGALSCPYCRHVGDRIIVLSRALENHSA